MDVVFVRWLKAEGDEIAVGDPLFEVDTEARVSVSVPVHLTGSPVGVVMGGLLDHSLHKVDITCKAGSIPDELVIDVGHLDLGDSLHVNELELPDGAEMVTHAELPVAAVVVPRGVDADQEEAAEGEMLYIPVISKGFQHQFWQAVQKGAEQAAADYGVEITFEGPETEAMVDKQVEMMQTALDKNPALADAWDELASIYKQKEQWKDLAQVLRKRLRELAYLMGTFDLTLSIGFHGQRAQWCQHPGMVVHDAHRARAADAVDEVQVAEARPAADVG